MSKQQQFSELLGQRLTAAHQETADDLMWQQLQQRINKRRRKLTLWLSSAASLAFIGILSGILYSGQIEPEPLAVSDPVYRYQLEKLDVAIQQSIIRNDHEQVERLIAQRQQLNKPQPRTYTL
ncbi:DUF3379 domain-containing protein [Arsukibacterium indicum]|uniref:DUF3379 domain-containing protein n=1 Tax=Arsukibacterium indicum TaxID=2848612 RepID=A0ABS6MNQ1_9GAMM|nr:DUF3379 domain-containing protein [Arsukibacterium indicum]MBV2130426.1 DUF3379 domain-containing protein [Arsukibacterium indicum]